MVAHKLARTWSVIVKGSDEHRIRLLGMQREDKKGAFSDVAKSSFAGVLEVDPVAIGF
jgi:hypothetical protein